MPQSFNRIISLGLIILLMVIFTYKSIENRSPFNNTLKTLPTLQTLQVQLQRDILRYRYGHIKQYDRINRIAGSVSSVANILLNTIAPQTSNDVYEDVVNINNDILKQNEIIEDFKTYNSIVQNSLIYFSREHERAVNNSERQYVSTTRAISKLSTYLLEYTRTPSHSIAKKVYPILDMLNEDANSDIHSLINHSLIIIEKLPEIEGQISKLRSIAIENKLSSLEEKISIIEHDMDQKARIYNALLFIFSTYIIIYLGFLFVALKRNKAELSRINNQLNAEVADRTKTEKTLSMLVSQNPTSETDDHIYNILHAVCDSLEVRYGYISYVSADDPNKAVMAGLIDKKSYKKNIPYALDGSPCEDVIKNGRVVCNRDMAIQYFDMHDFPVKQATSFIGVALKDIDKNVKGLIAIAHDEAIENTNLYESILTIAATRAGTELLRQIEQQNNSRYQNGLKLIDKWVRKLIASASSKNDFFKNTCLAAQEITGATHAALPVLDQTKERYTYVDATGENAGDLKQLELSINDGGICAWSMTNAKNLLIADVKYDLRAKKQIASKFNIKSALVTPLELNDEVFGALAVFNSNISFDEIDEQLISQLGKNIQMALANMQLINDIETEKERAQVTLHSIGDAVITTNSIGNIEYMNQIAEQLTGWPLQGVKNTSVKNVFKIFDHATHEPIYNLVDTCLREGKPISRTIITLIGNNGIEREIECSMSPILSTDNSTEGVVIIFHDESEKHRLENIIEHQSTHDSLTSLINRDEFTRQLTAHVFDAKKFDREHSLAFIDLDRFKLINDSCGHSAGDELLKQITVLLGRCTRNGDIIGRIGGDEFGIILVNCPTKSAIHISEKIADEINNLQFNWQGNMHSIGSSIGITQVTSDTIDTSEVVTQADIACHTAKDYGENNVYVYEQQDIELILKKEEIHWASRISDAISKHQFLLYAQTIEPLHKSELKKIEILIRLRDDEGHLSEPNAFIPAAERYNLMSNVDRLVIETTFRYIQDSDDPRISDISFSINLSGNSLNTKDLSAFIKQKITQYDIDAKKICFELTETAAIVNLQKTRLLIQELKIIGCQFSLDDFGSGLSSFGYLKNLPVDYIKIDGSFVKDMVENKIDHAMVAAINQVGHVMGIKTIAEFAESSEIITQLTEIGVDFAQGYHISRPVALSEILKNDFLSHSLPDSA